MPKKKNALRQKYNHLDYPTSELAKKSHQICNHLDQLLSSLSIHHIGTFYPTQREPNIWPIISKYTNLHNLYLPKYNHHLNHYEWAPHTPKLVPGKYNILEPTSSPTTLILDACLVPAICIDQSFNRIGWGHGYFDRLLKPSITHKIGIIFDYQFINESIPIDPWDIPLTSIITEKSIYKKKPTI